MLLDGVNSAQDLRKLSLEELPALAEEIRVRIVQVVSSCGGHLASSLGAVELIIALHYCLDTPKDKIIFDVGHQAYAHKILTGRNKAFDTLRQFQGLSGFPSKDECAYDCFTTGHSSNAVSLALGLVCARDYASTPQDSFKVVAVIGDGSLSGGLCFEGLNNAGHLKKDILVVLNTNELSIAPNVGALSTYLNKLISLPIYNRFRASLEHFVKSRVPKGSRILKLAIKFEEGLKGLFVPGIFFEELGFRYFGPFDGHNLQTLIPAIRNILNIKGPRLLHVVTKKGKGYLPAENEPVRFHGIGPFNPKTGASIADEQKTLTYTQVFGRKLTDLAKLDKNIVAITAAMPEGTGLDRFRDLYPERFFDVGIAEGHAVSFAGGLAKQGLKPVVAIYSTFLQRAVDQLIEDVALQNLGVIFCIDRAGIVGEDGVTHHGLFDINYLRMIPNLAVLAPKDAQELEAMFEFAVGLNKPVAIRYPRDRSPDHQFTSSQVKIELGKAEILKQGKDICIIALGSMVGTAWEATGWLEKDGFSATLVNSRFVKPLDTQLLKDIQRRHKFIFTVEEGILDGGFGSAVAEAMDKPGGSGLPSDRPQGHGLASDSQSHRQSHKPVARIGLPCEFIPHGNRELLLDKYGLSPRGIYNTIKKWLT
ncbi:MAG: 1-deoxy-D-xylulose-5-phosphate synthase [Candidatus Omnitrophota bacterium]